MIFSSLIFFTLIYSIDSYPWFCHFDNGEICLQGISTSSFVLLNETSDRPRQPPSDISSIQTSNDQGQCYFPYSLGSFEMFFCHKFDENLPSTCPTGNSTGPKINCSDGEYGYHRFDRGEMTSVSYEINLHRSPDIGEHCFSFYYYFSDEISNGKIDLFISNENLTLNKRIETNLFNNGNQWSLARIPLKIEYFITNFSIIFQRLNSTSLNEIFSIAIDEMSIIDLPCEPPQQTTTTTTTISTTTIRTCPTTTTTSSRITDSTVNPTSKSSSTMKTTFGSTTIVSSSMNLVVSTVSFICLLSMNFLLLFSLT